MLSSDINLLRSDDILPAALLSGSHHRDLHAVDRRQRVEEATPFLAAVTTDPELAGRGAEVERGRAEVVDVHRVPQDREVALLLRHSACEPLPRAAAVLAAPDRGAPPGQVRVIGSSGMT